MIIGSGGDCGKSEQVGAAHPCRGGEGGEEEG